MPAIKLATPSLLLLLQAADQLHSPVTMCTLCVLSCALMKQRLWQPWSVTCTMTAVSAATVSSALTVAAACKPAVVVYIGGDWSHFNASYAAYRGSMARSYRTKRNLYDIKELCRPIVRHGLIPIVLIQASSLMQRCFTFGNTCCFWQYKCSHSNDNALVCLWTSPGKMWHREFSTEKHWSANLWH